MTAKKDRPVQEQRRKRGPRFTTEDRQATERRLIDAAVELLKQKGLDALSFPRLAEWEGVDITATAPLHYFGSRVGLLGAIAERGFRDLAKRLTTLERESSDSGAAVVQLAVAYAKYALNNRHLYRAIHEGSLWRAVTAPPTDRAAAKQRVWTTAAKEARNDAFDVFARAIRDTGARVVTCLVDGYLFQALEEQVDARHTIAKKLEDVERMVRVAVRGLTV
jgi:AcrR family transcriptional regulator